MAKLHLGERGSLRLQSEMESLWAGIMTGLDFGRVRGKEGLNCVMGSDLRSSTFKLGDEGGLPYADTLLAFYGRQLRLRTPFRTYSAARGLNCVLLSILEAARFKFIDGGMLLDAYTLVTF